MVMEWAGKVFGCSPGDWYREASQFGAVAQLAERFHGMEEVRGSIPLSSTRKSAMSRLLG